MNTVERFRAVMSFQPVDRLPVIEWAPWWDQTLERWYGEGLPGHLTEAAQIRAHLGLDSYRQLWVRVRGEGCPEPPAHGAGIVQDMGGYLALKPYLYPRPMQAREAWADLRAWAEQQRAGETVVWITLDGFFWYPRTLLGIQRHLYSFYDDPELMHAMNQDLADYYLWVIDQICQACTPDFMTFAEDMSYNHGPMLSKGFFDGFIAPYYHQIIPALKERGIIPLVDSDGDVAPLIPWLIEAGVEGILPLERMAGVDVNQIRADHPHFKMIGAFDKTVMHRGEEAIRREFQRLWPVMRSGGYIPSCDHQTPPEVSLEDYRLYVSLLKEYCGRAG